MSETLTLPAWMGGVDLTKVGFPLPVDRSLYEKRRGLVYKETTHGPLLLDAYLPHAVDNPPLVVMIHGGGWQHGGRSDMGLSRWAGYLACAGMAVVSIDYRLAPATTYPYSFQDCLDALDWSVEHAKDLGVDPERIGLWGDSAGGHLVLLIATSQTHPEFSGPRMRTDSKRIRSVVAWYPPTDLLRLHRSESRGPTRTVMNFVGADPEAEPARWREVSPIEHVHAALPPTMILQGTRDFLVPHKQAVSYAERLTAVGAKHELHILEGGLHGFDRLDPGPEAIALIEKSREFLTTNLL